MKILSIILLSSTLELGTIIPMGSQIIYWGQPENEFSYYVKYTTTITLLDRLSITGGIEDSFIYNGDLKRNPINWSPLLDTYLFKVNFNITDGFDIYANHYCKHLTDCSPEYMYLGTRSQTRVGIKLTH